MMTDAMLTARPEYRRAMSKAARPLPLAFGEVAELPRRRTSGHVLRDALIGLACLIVAVSGACALIAAVAG